MQKIQPIECNNIGVKPRGVKQRVQTQIRGKSLTQQSDTALCCIHKMLDKYSSTGLIRQTLAQPLPENLPEPGSFHEAMNIVVHAQQTFDELPVDIRQRFNNDPKEFLEFATDKENLPELRELGLADPELNPPQVPSKGNEPPAGDTPPKTEEPTPPAPIADKTPVIDPDKVDVQPTT